VTGPVCEASVPLRMIGHFNPRSNKLDCNQRVRQRVTIEPIAKGGGMSKRILIDKDGRQVELDLADGAPIPSGYGIRVPSYLCDGVPQVIADAPHRLTDALGNRAGSRPGFVFNRDADETQAVQAHRDMIARQESAWKSPPVVMAPERSGAVAAVADNGSMWPSGWGGPRNPTPKPPDQTLSRSSARDAYISYLENAWQSTPTSPTDISNRLPRLGGWVDRNPLEKPRDVAVDAAPDANAEYRAMIRRQENSWRTAK
jgi:hypothetical protein